MKFPKPGGQKKKNVPGTVKSLDMALDKNYYDSYNPAITKKILKSGTDKVRY